MATARFPHGIASDTPQPLAHIWTAEPATFLRCGFGSSCYRPRSRWCRIRSRRCQRRTPRGWLHCRGLAQNSNSLHLNGCRNNDTLSGTTFQHKGTGLQEARARGGPGSRRPGLEKTRVRGGPGSRKPGLEVEENTGLQEAGARGGPGSRRPGLEQTRVGGGPGSEESDGPPTENTVNPIFCQRNPSSVSGFSLRGPERKRKTRKTAPQTAPTKQTNHQPS